MATIFVVDDEDSIRKELSEILVDEGYTVHLAGSAGEARELRDRIAPDLVLLDIWMPDTDGITLMTEWSAAFKLTMPVVMLTAEGTIDTAVETIQAGAVDFIEKPIALKKLLQTVERCLFGTPVRSRPMPERAVNGSSGTVRVPVPDHVPVQAGAFRTSEARPAVPPSVQSFNLDQPIQAARHDFETSYFEFHLVLQNGSMTRVAEKTGLGRTHLYRKLKQLGIDTSRAKPIDRNERESGDPALRRPKPAGSGVAATLDSGHLDLG